MEAMDVSATQAPNNQALFLPTLSKAFNSLSLSKKTVILHTVLPLPFLTLRLLFQDFITFSPITQWSTPYIFCNTLLECQIFIDLLIFSNLVQHHLFAKSFCSFGHVARTWAYGAAGSLFCVVIIIGCLGLGDSPNLRPPLTVVFTVLSCLIAFLIMLLVCIWMMALVITVSEENCHGRKAIRRAFEIYRKSKLHGFALMVLFSTLALALLGLLGLIISISGQKNKSICYASTVVLAALVSPLALYMFEVSVALYDEDRRSKDEELKGDEDHLCANLLSGAKLSYEV